MGAWYDEMTEDTRKVHEEAFPDGAKEPVKSYITRSHLVDRILPDADDYGQPMNSRPYLAPAYSRRRNSSSAR
jgi:hypothetical protein